jgi:hypothetical protein
MRDMLGPAHRDTLAFAGRLARILFRLGRTDKAFDLAADGFARCRSRFGPDDVQTLEMMSLLASLHRLRGNRGEALRLMEDLYARRQDVLGRTHPYTLVIAARMTEILLDKGKISRARGLRRSLVAHYRPDGWPPIPDGETMRHEIESALRRS